MSRQMRLIAEPHARGDACNRLPVEKSPSRCLDTPAEQVRVRRNAERLAEAAHEMRRARSEELCRGRERHRLECVHVKELTQAFRELVGATGILRSGFTAEVRPEALRDEREVCLGLELVVGVTEPPVKEIDAMA
jgi:hypothetical protein